MYIYIWQHIIIYIYFSITHINIYIWGFVHCHVFMCLITRGYFTMNPGIKPLLRVVDQLSGVILQAVTMYKLVTLYAIWKFPEMGVQPNGWFIRENPIIMDDLGIPPICGNNHLGSCCSLKSLTNWQATEVSLLDAQKSDTSEPESQ